MYKDLKRIANYSFYMSLINTVYSHLFATNSDFNRSYGKTYTNRATHTKLRRKGYIIIVLIYLQLTVKIQNKNKKN